MSDNESLIGFDPLAWMKEDEEEGAEPQAAAAEPTPPPAAEIRAAEPQPEPVVAEPRIEPEPEPEPLAAAPAAEEVGVLTIRLGDSLDISVVGAVYQELNQVLEKGRDVLLDASELERTDTAALQMLTAFAQDMGARGAQVRWQTPSAELRQSARLLGLEGPLGLGG